MNDSESNPVEGKRILFRNMGWVLILLSGVFFFAMLSIPWWPLGNSHKVFWGGALFVAVQAAWWVGVVLVGPAAMSKLNAWRRKSKEPSNVD